MEQYTDIQICIGCRKQYKRTREEQVRNFEVDYDACPYCHTVNGQSMRWNYFSYPMTDDTGNNE